MLTADTLERLREATIDDVGGILRLIEPLEADGTLVRRGRELLEQEIGRFTVLEHDRLILGCAALYPFPKARAGELACLAVHPDYRERRPRREDHGRDRGARARRGDEAALRADDAGDALVRRARLPRGRRRRLPGAAEELYNWQRRSKVLVKPLK